MRQHQGCCREVLGAVGTGAAQGKNEQLQKIILEHLGVGVIATTQVVGRDRYIEYVHWLGNTNYL